MPIDGLVSGLDTNAMVTQLMELERKPRTDMATRQAAAKSSLDALASIATKLEAITSAAGALQRSSGWKARSATSSDPNAATATVVDGAAIGALSFTVDRLASAHGVATATDVASGATVIAPGGSITITIGATPQTISVGGGTLTEVADAINANANGVRAAVVNTGSGVRLQMTATATGEAATFTVGGLGLGTVVTTNAADAQLTIGSGPGAYSVTSATNTFSNLLPGVSVTATRLTATPIDLTISSDTKALSDKVKALVDAVNSALSEIKTRTAYDPTTRSAASLTGDGSVRRLAQALTKAVTEVVSQSTLGSPGLAGVSVDRTGKLNFDAAKFTAAHQADPVAVERLFVQGGTTTGSVSFLSAGDSTRPGTYDVVVTQLATTASLTGLTGTTWPVDPQPTIVARRNGVTASYTVQPTDTEVEVRAGLQAAIDAAGITLDVTVDGTGLRLDARAPGSGEAFEVAWDGTTFTPAAAVDVAGTIDGVVATGSGTTLGIASTDPKLGGLNVSVAGAALGLVGTITFESGLAHRLATVVHDATVGEAGYLNGASNVRQRSIDALEKSIAAYDRRLTVREALLRKQFAAMEVALGNMKSQSEWLATQLSSLQAQSSGND